MSAPTTPCCVVSLNQQQHTTTCHQNQLAQSADQTLAAPKKTKHKYCTVVENGRVVVKPITAD